MNNNTTHSAISVADYVITKSLEQGRSLTPMQVIKLVYLCHGWMLGLYNRPLIDEYVEAWQYGPVIRTLYSAVKRFRSSPVVPPLSVGQKNFDDEEKSIMEQVVDVYKEFNGVQLSQLTHAKGTPWEITFKKNKEFIISNDLIKSHFKSLLQEQAESQQVAAA